MNIELIKSDDLSHTIFNKEIGDTYHSSFGAITESKFIYIKNGLELFDNYDNIRILEVGMGTGLNVLLSIIWNNEKKSIIEYKSIEKNPIPEETYKQLNYPQLLQCKSDLFLKIHQSKWAETIEISDRFKFSKIKVDLLDFDTDEKFDLIYFDAFSPEVQAELWTNEVFNKIYKFINENGFLVTYSSKGIVKQNLRTNGFLVKRLAGPPGKRHILRAYKKTNNA